MGAWDVLMGQVREDLGGLRSSLIDKEATRTISTANAS